MAIREGAVKNFGFVIAFGLLSGGSCDPYGSYFQFLFLFAIEEPLEGNYESFSLKIVCWDVVSDGWQNDPCMQDSSVSNEITWISMGKWDNPLL